MFGGYTKKVLDEKYNNAQKEVQQRIKDLSSK
jgi:hypothetical protein